MHARFCRRLNIDFIPAARWLMPRKWRQLGNSHIINDSKKSQATSSEPANFLHMFMSARSC
jgi:hypothetical protein